MTTQIESYVQGQWHAPNGELRHIHNATTEEEVAVLGSDELDFQGVLDHARNVGGPALRAMTFAERGAMLKALSGAIHEHRDELLDISAANGGTTRKDGKFDIDGATGTLAAYAYFAKELGDRHVIADGAGIQLGRTARFWGQHIYTPRLGAAVHINAFNFPAWNMMEKAACSLLAGVPVIEKPGLATSLVAYKVAKIAIDSGLLPEGSFQFISARVGDLLDRLDRQDVMAFTGSARTGAMLKGNANLVTNNVRVNIEADSLNAAVLAPHVEEGGRPLRGMEEAADLRQHDGQVGVGLRAGRHDHADAVRLEQVARLAAAEVGVDQVQVGAVIEGQPIAAHFTLDLV